MKSDYPLLRGAILFTGALVGGAIPGANLPLDKLIDSLFAHQDAQERRKLQRFTEAMAAELATVCPPDVGIRAAVCLKIEAAIRRGPISHQRFVELNLDPAAATDELSHQLDFATRSERFELEPHCRALTRRYYEKLVNLADLLPHSCAVLLQRQAAHGKKLDAILETIKQQTELLQHEKGIPHAALVQHLVKLGADPRIDQAEMQSFLERFADEFVALREKWTRATNAYPGIGAAREEAIALLNAGDLDGTRQLFRTTRERIRELRQEKAREEATLLADEAAVDRLELRYRNAATLLAEAADITAFDPEASWRHRLAQADVLDDLGNEFGDNAALLEAIATYEKALALAPRDTRPEDWATTQNNLGNALRTLGERESDTTILRRALKAHEVVLGEWTRERAPLKWAGVQNNLGIVFGTIASIEPETATLGCAVKAFQASLLELTPERAPHEWATTQTNLGRALQILGERERGTTTLERAVEAHQAALIVRTRERMPLEWAQTQNNLGTTLRILGSRESGTRNLERAVEAHEAALVVRTRERVPLAWAATQHDLGSAMLILGTRQGRTRLLRRAERAFKAALLEGTRERVPSDWAMTMNSLGAVLTTLGDKDNNIATLRSAVDTCNLALLVRTRDRVPFDWAITQGNLGNALRVLSDWEAGTTTLELAIRAYENALLELTQDRAPFFWALTSENLAIALLGVARRGGNAECLRGALDAVDGALEEYRAGKASFHIEKAERLRADVVAALDELAD